MVGGGWLVWGCFTIVTMVVVGVLYDMMVVASDYSV